MIPYIYRMSATLATQGQCPGATRSVGWRKIFLTFLTNKRWTVTARVVMYIIVIGTPSEVSGRLHVPVESHFDDPSDSKVLVALMTNYLRPPERRSYLPRLPTSVGTEPVLRWTVSADAGAFFVTCIRAKSGTKNVVQLVSNRQERYRSSCRGVVTTWRFGCCKSHPLQNHRQNVLDAVHHIGKAAHHR
ncbi:uncharacterized protein K489DRAFT_189365 [Dissoconium aciculare CBS 342.82]|uniref:Uncharacterized protein n=1 Tax=Dissoconium aciculare CBS 342.82 TaxID=1314786 RepID=A0A6J3M9N4_9PEZI|nr:uncharacterized protein K489DRAFT_189365 [Dissoconium aciculare CBS 342.82]KAF1824761.1 hypothetical protein K489DRAFT_189365 [Dissoconium aciculare CBS 342.82]